MKKSYRNFLKRTRIIVILIMIVISVSGGIQMFRYHQAAVLCDKIKAGEEIQTKFSNGTTAPKFSRRIATILQTDGPKIPLVEACYYKNVQAVKVLLENGADPNFFFNGDWSPLDASVVTGIDEKSFTIIQLLVEHGVNVNLYGSGSPLAIELSSFIYFGNDNEMIDEVLLYLLSRGASIEWNGNNSVFYGVVGGGHLALTEILIDQYGCDVNQKMIRGESALMVSVLNPNLSPNPKMIELLLQKGADRSIRDDFGNTAYDYALERGYTEIAELLKP